MITRDGARALAWAAWLTGNLPLNALSGAPKTPARIAAPERVRDPRPGRSPAPEQARPDGGA